MAEKERCSESIFERGWDHSCQHKVTAHENGQPYCTIHAPSYIARKRAEWMAKFEATQAAEKARIKEKEAQRALQARHAALYPELVEALRLMRAQAIVFTVFRDMPGEALQKQVDDVLAKARAIEEAKE